MAAPIVVQVTPEDKETDVVLGQSIVVVFDQAIDTTSVDDDTFSLTCPAPTQILTSGQLISGEAGPSEVSVTGKWTFSTDEQGRTVATFQPDKPFEQNTPYTATLFGSDADLSTRDVMNAGGESMAKCYQWTFTSGVLNLTVPPVTSPLADAQPVIPPGQIRVIPRRTTGQDFTQAFDVLFPDEIDPSSVDLNALYMSIEPILGDPSIAIPSGLQYAAAVNGNKISITINGWTQ